MKKLYVLALIAIATSLGGCTPKESEVQIVSTGDVEQVTWSTDTDTPIIADSEMEEFTGEFDSGVVAVLSGSDTVTDIQSGVANEVKDIIDERATQPKDETKLTEEDIDLIDKIIQKVQGLKN